MTRVPAGGPSGRENVAARAAAEARVDGVPVGGERRPGRVAISVPATTANLGPGFDTVGAALDIVNEIHWFPRAGREARGGDGDPAAGVADAGGTEVVVRGEGAEALQSGGARNLVLEAARTAFGGPLPPGRLELVNRIPLARGLGSSAAAIVGGVALGLALAGRDPEPGDILPLAVGIEGHADNVAPAVLGGVQVVGGRGEAHRIACPRLHGLLVIPDVELPTSRARGVLPERVELETAVRALQRVALLVGALGAGDDAKLREATRDEIHQDRRAALVPGLGEVLSHARDRLNLAAVISGSGPTLLALSSAPIPDRLGRELAARWAEFGVAAQWRSVRVGAPGMRLGGRGARAGERAT